MRYFSYIITFFAHPIWFPIYGAMLVLFQIPFSPTIEIVKYTWLLLLLITVALPTLVYLMLFVLNWLDDPFEVPLEKQKWLRCGYIAMLLLTAFKVTPMDHFVFLYNEFAHQHLCHTADALFKICRQYVCNGSRSPHRFQHIAGSYL